MRVLESRSGMKLDGGMVGLVPVEVAIIRAAKLV